MAEENDSLFVLDSSKLDGYPSIYGQNPPHEYPFQIPDSLRQWIYSDLQLDRNKLFGYPSFEEQSEPYKHDWYIPDSLKIWIESDFTLNPIHLKGYPSFDSDNQPVVLPNDVPEAVHIWLYSDFSVDENKIGGYPSQSFNGEFIETFGAFSNVPTLETVKIPKSVKYIADFAFWNTNITEVTINKECVYEEHSFPKDCVINRYD